VSAFSLEQRDIDGGCREISVGGELDLAVAGRLDEAISAVEQSCAGVVIGLTDCEFIDSTGIAVIVRARRRLAEEGRRLVVCCPEEQVERVLDVTGLMADGLVFDSLEEAVAAIEARRREG
jgi:anti-sigma B factor antagonist